MSWDLYLEEDFRLRLPGIERWRGDGIIADFDDPAVCEALARSALPVVAVGGSYQDEADSSSWGRENVYDVYTKSQGKALDGTYYKDW